MVRQLSSMPYRSLYIPSANFPTSSNEINTNKYQDKEESRRRGAGKQEEEEVDKHTIDADNRLIHFVLNPKR